eukprot:TRINITY_DN1280_c0_g1_i1.p3 TRINITY_DN1280_c0_g1~~TRINITY_DN1280_c0_g1_i1.p3  ORF type:complete len:53 (+),score=29.31 TRINITY_DN1280_c0_g1_i1:496-654(+)
MLDDWEATHELTDLPQDVWQYLKDNKFFAMIIKKKKYRLRGRSSETAKAHRG